MFFRGMFTLAIVLLIAPIFLPSLDIPVGLVSTLTFEILGIIILLFTSYLAAYKKFFVIAESNQAVIRTGGLGKAASDEPSVAIGKGLWCIPMIHKHRVFRFEQWVITVERKDENALLCQDNLLANAKITFKISVPQSAGSVLKFLAAVGERIIDEQTIQLLCNDTLETALRDACTSRDYQTVFESREAVGEAIESSVSNDLPKIGLQLDSAKMTDVEPTPINFYQQENPQHAKGLTAIVKITEDQKLATETKKLTTQEAIRKQEVETQKKILSLNQDEEFAKSEQTKEIEMRQAQNKRAAEEQVIEQNEAVEKRRIAKEKLIQLETIAREREAENARITKDQSLAEAEVAKERSVQMANENKAIELAKKSAEKAEAEKLRQESEAKAEKAVQDVLTVQLLERAQREKQKAVIEQEAKSEQELIKAQKAAEASAYAIERDAEARKTAAEADYIAKTRAAEAMQKEAEADAAGKRASAMIPVEVERELVEVAQQRVEVLEKELRAKSEHSEAALNFELQKFQIEKNAEVRIEMAKAVAQLTTNVKATLYGDSSTLEKVTSGMAKSFGIASFLEGLEQEAPENIKTLFKEGVDVIKSKLS